MRKHARRSLLEDINTADVLRSECEESMDSNLDDDMKLDWYATYARSTSECYQTLLILSDIIKFVYTIYDHVAAPLGLNAWLIDWLIKLGFNVTFSNKIEIHHSHEVTQHVFCFPWSNTTDLFGTQYSQRYEWEGESLVITMHVVALICAELPPSNKHPQDIQIPKTQDSPCALQRELQVNPMWRPQVRA